MKIKTIVFLGLLSISLLGCSSIFHRNQGVIGQASIADEKAKARIDLIETSAANVNVERLEKIGAFSAGVDYSLSKVSNAPPAVDAAIELNKRIMALADKPDFKEAQEITFLVDTLISNRIDGEYLLSQKDKEIENLASTVKDIQSEKDSAISKYISQADKTAEAADQLHATLSQMDSFGGLGAIFYGLKEFITKAAWILGIGGTIFFVLRILSFSNPLAASIFSIFSQIGAWGINTLEYIFPKAINAAELVAKTAYNDAETVIEEVLSGIKTAEAASKATNTPLNATAVISSISNSLTPAQQTILNNAVSPAQQNVLTNLSTITSTSTNTSGSVS